MKREVEKGVEVGGNLGIVFLEILIYFSGQTWLLLCTNYHNLTLNNGIWVYTKELSMQNHL